MSEKKTKLKTKSYYTDYVNHMIRFYLSTPGGLDLMARKYTSASVNNWTAVQLVFNHLTASEFEKVCTIYKDYGHHLPKAVEAYCKDKGADIEETWKLLTKVSSKIARARGLMP